MPKIIDFRAGAARVFATTLLGMADAHRAGETSREEWFNAHADVWNRAEDLGLDDEVGALTGGRDWIHEAPDPADLDDARYHAAKDEGLVR